MWLNEKVNLKNPHKKQTTTTKRGGIKIGNDQQKQSKNWQKQTIEIKNLEVNGMEIHKKGTINGMKCKRQRQGQEKQFWWKING